VIATVGAWVSQVTVTLLDVGFPAVSVAVTVMMFVPLASAIPVKLQAASVPEKVPVEPLAEFAAVTVPRATLSEAVPLTVRVVLFVMKVGAGGVVIASVGATGS
jgi:hypothetical protein